jgi:hypothetical protein
MEKEICFSFCLKSDIQTTFHHIVPDKAIVDILLSERRASLQQSGRFIFEGSMSDV